MSAALSFRSAHLPEASLPSHLSCKGRLSLHISSEPGINLRLTEPSNSKSWAPRWCDSEMDLILIRILHRERSDRMQIYIHICTNAYTYTRSPSILTDIYSYMHTHMHIHTHIYVYTHTHMHIYWIGSANMESLRSDRKDWNIRLKEGDF